MSSSFMQSSCSPWIKLPNFSPSSHQAYLVRFITSCVRNQSSMTEAFVNASAVLSAVKDTNQQDKNEDGILPFLTSYLKKIVSPILKLIFFYFIKWVCRQLLLEQKKELLFTKIGSKSTMSKSKIYL